MLLPLPQHTSKRMMIIMLQSHPPPQLPPKIPFPFPHPLPQKSNKRIIQIQELFPPSQLPHPQFVAAKSLIVEPPINLFTLYTML